MSTTKPETSSLFPSFLYSTAWKEERTQELVIQALNTAFTGIDTANQRKHYFEEAVGWAIQDFLESSTAFDLTQKEHHLIEIISSL